MNLRHLCVALPLGLFAASAFAHPGHESAGFLSDIIHLFGGLDHLLAMLALGLFAAWQIRAVRWRLSRPARP